MRTAAVRRLLESTTKLKSVKGSSKPKERSGTSAKRVKKCLEPTMTKVEKAEKQHWDALAESSVVHVTELAAIAKETRVIMQLLDTKVEAASGVHKTNMKTLQAKFAHSHKVLSEMSNFFSQTIAGASTFFWTSTPAANRLVLTSATVESLLLLARSLKFNSQKLQHAAIQKRAPSFRCVFKVWFKMVNAAALLMTGGLNKPLTGAERELFELNEAVPRIAQRLAPAEALEDYFGIQLSPQNLSAALTSAETEVMTATASSVTVTDTSAADWTDYLEEEQLDDTTEVTEAMKALDIDFDQIQALIEDQSSSSSSSADVQTV